MLSKQNGLCSQAATPIDSRDLFTLVRRQAASVIHPSTALLWFVPMRPRRGCRFRVIEDPVVPASSAANRIAATRSVWRGMRLGRPSQLLRGQPIAETACASPAINNATSCLSFSVNRNRYLLSSQLRKFAIDVLMQFNLSPERWRQHADGSVLKRNLNTELSITVSVRVRLFD